MHPQERYVEQAKQALQTALAATAGIGVVGYHGVIGFHEVNTETLLQVDVFDVSAFVGQWLEGGSGLGGLSIRRSPRRRELF